MLSLISRLPVVRYFWPRQAKPTQIDHRAIGNQAALIFIHGFTGDVAKTWGGFIQLLAIEASVSSWDIISLGFPSSLRVDVPGLWSADPDLDILSRGLRTSLSTSPLRQYKCIALIAHSMGGLIAQRALLDDADLRTRISHVLLYATPSGGLEKVRFFSAFKRQLQGMAARGNFITELRTDWRKSFPGGPDFFFRVIAGNRDEFVPATSSLEPFDDRFREVVTGHHLSIVRPTSRNDTGFQIAVDALNGKDRIRTVIDGARIAVELRNFQVAINTLLHRATELDEVALTDLAMALDGVGRGDEALQVLDARFAADGLASTDAKGALAGRVKRSWLLHRIERDRIRARELYMLALIEAEVGESYDQAYYHAINVAFIDTLASPSTSPVPELAIILAKKSLSYCAKCVESNWRLATEGEAQLMLGDLNASCDLYRRAIAITISPREAHSMYAQASRLAFRVFGESGLSAIEVVFGLSMQNTVQQYGK